MRKLNPFWLLGCLIAICVIFICSLQLFPVNYNKLDIETKQIYEKSLIHLENLSKTPHYYGSEGHENIKNYIISIIQKYNLQPTIQKGASLYNFNFSSTNKKSIFAYVENIYVEIPGKSEDKICIVAHYDSVPHTYSAADNSTAVAASLSYFEKIASDYLKGDTFNNSIVFLFTDAEEIGLLGAKYFVDNYKDINKIKAVLNLDARGNQGKSILFQSYDSDNILVKHYAKFDKKLIGFSFANDIYERMPNATDFTLFMDKGIDGLNFAFIQNSVVYHSFVDNQKNISRNSISETIFKVKNYLEAFMNYNFPDKAKNKISENKKSQELIYFTFFGRLILISSKILIILLGIISFLFFIFFLFNLKKNYFSIKEFLISILQNLMFLVVFPLSLLAAKYLIYLLFPALNIFYLNPYDEFIYFLVIYAIAYLVVHLLGIKISKYLHFHAFYQSAIFLSILMAILFYIFLKGISIIFFAQSIAYLLAIVNKRLFDKFYEKLENSIFYPVHFVLLVIPLSFGIPFSYLSYVALGLRNITFTFIGLFPIIIFFASNYRDILPFDKKIISSFLIFLIIVLIVLITININFTEKKPIISTMTLSKDNDTSYFNIILPYNEVKYSNNPWYKSILSLGQVSKDKYNYIVYEISEIKLPKFEFIKILSTNETKTYKEYNLEIKSNSWNFTLPANSQVSIKNYINLNFNEISTLKGYTPFNKTIIIKIRIPLKEILKYKVMNPFYEEKYNFNIPKRPKEIIGYYDSIVETGTLK